MTDAPPIVLSAGQKHVYDAIYRLTDRGRHAWIGQLSLIDMADSSVRGALHTLDALNVIVVEKQPGTKARRFLVRAWPNRIVVGDPREVCVARWTEKNVLCEAAHIRDSGAFMALVQRLGLPLFKDDLRAPKSSGVVSRMALSRPDARAL